MRDPHAARHIPVLLREVELHMDLRAGLIVADGTVGAGGHSQMIARRIGDTGTLLGIDRDPMMLQIATNVLGQSRQVILHQASYVELENVLKTNNMSGVDRVLLDLGLSSDQLSDTSRGFSFQAVGPLDLRFDPRAGQSAKSLLRTATESELERILREYGEDSASHRIAKCLSSRAATKPLETAAELSECIVECLGMTKRDLREKHPATRVFQALRIAVNNELEHVARGVEHVIHRILNPGGIAAVITFHSLEDRIVKQEFRRTNSWQNLTPRPIVATHQEQRVNPRSRSAKLRVARKLI